MVFRVVIALSLMKAATACRMPVLEPSVCLCTYKYICCLQVGCLRSPSESSYWHIVGSAILVYEATEGECTFSRLSIVNSNGTIAKSTCEIFVGRIKSTREDLRIRITERHFMRETPRIALLIMDPLSLSRTIARCLDPLVFIILSKFVHIDLRFEDLNS